MVYSVCIPGDGEQPHYHHRAMTFSDTQLDSYEGADKAWDALHEWMHSKGYELDSESENAFWATIQEQLTRCTAQPVG